MFFLYELLHDVYDDLYMNFEKLLEIYEILEVGTTADPFKSADYVAAIVYTDKLGMSAEDLIDTAIQDFVKIPATELPEITEVKTLCFTLKFDLCMMVWNIFLT